MRIIAVLTIAPLMDCARLSIMLRSWPCADLTRSLIRQVAQLKEKEYGRSLTKKRKKKRGRKLLDTALLTLVSLTWTRMSKTTRLRMLSGAREAAPKMDSARITQFAKITIQTELA